MSAPKSLKVTRAEIERAARMYGTNTDARRALRIDLATFSRLCRQYGIETPFERRRRLRVKCPRG